VFWFGMWKVKGGVKVKGLFTGGGRQARTVRKVVADCPPLRGKAPPQLSYFCFARPQSTSDSPGSICGLSAFIQLHHTSNCHFSVLLHFSTPDSPGPMCGLSALIVLILSRTCPILSSAQLSTADSPPLRTGQSGVKMSCEFQKTTESVCVPLMNCGLSAIGAGLSGCQIPELVQNLSK
jgi:hypothetical protein